MSCGTISHVDLTASGQIDAIACCGSAVVDGIFFGPFAAGLDVFDNDIGAAFVGFYHLGGGGGGGGGSFGGGNDIDIPPDPHIFDGSANHGGPGDDIGDDDDGGGGGNHGDPGYSGGFVIVPN